MSEAFINKPKLTKKRKDYIMEITISNATAETQKIKFANGDLVNVRGAIMKISSISEKPLSITLEPGNVDHIKEYFDNNPSERNVVNRDNVNRDNQPTTLERNIANQAADRVKINPQSTPSQTARIATPGRTPTI